MGLQVPHLFEHGGARHVQNPADDHAPGLAAGVRVHRLDHAREAHGSVSVLNGSSRILRGAYLVLRREALVVGVRSPGQNLPSAGELILDQAHAVICGDSAEGSAGPKPTPRAVFWSAAILKTRRASRGAAVAGIVIGVGILAAFFSGLLRLDVHGFGIMIFAQSCWLIWVGILMFRGEETSAEPEVSTRPA